ncbi:MAG: cytochrome c3 family protein [Desulfobulbaceae bacterium]
MRLPVALLSLTLILMPGTGPAQPAPVGQQGSSKNGVLQPLRPIAGPTQGKTASPRQADPYLDSAHGSTEKGVLRPEKAREGFARANCSHCHDFHGESELSGSDGGRNKAFPYTLYAQNFDVKARTGLYAEPTNFCFSCHNSKGSVQQLPNSETSKTLGCSTLQGATDILGAFNQKSRHNLYDIWKYFDTDSKDYRWVTRETNPCSACHNPHLARNHSDNPRSIEFSSLSRPSDHSALWMQSMGDSYATQYEPPFCSNQDNREPAATPRDDQARAAMIDYVAFCTDCHDDKKSIHSSTLERKLVQIDWSFNGDVHGGKGASQTLSVKPPYRVNSQKNYILSCLDCHEPHGSANSALLRDWVNGNKLLGSVTLSLTTPLGTGRDTQNTEMGFLCMRCHQQDADTGTNAANPPRWQTVHHGAEEVSGGPSAPPYALGECETCHEMESAASDTPLPIECVNCHYHGSTDGWLREQATKRVTF